MNRTPSLLFCAIALTVFAAPGARADLTLRQAVTMSGGTAPGAKSAKPTTEKSVAYYKATKQRTETGDIVTIYDAAADKTYTLNTKTKTYYEETSAQKVASGSATPYGDLVQFGGDASVSDTGEQKTIAGKTARHYTYSMSLKLTPKDANAPQALLTMLPSFEITGDQWTVETPESAAAPARPAALLARFPPGMSAGLKPLVEKMSRIKGIPVESSQSVKMAFSPLAPPDVIATAPKDPLLIQTKTTTLSETPLPDSLFTVPSDYKKVDAPTAKPGA